MHHKIELEDIWLSSRMLELIRDELVEFNTEYGNTEVQEQIDILNDLISDE